MKKALRTSLKILGIIAAVIISPVLLLLGFVFFMNWKDTWDHSCEKGLLLNIAQCSYDQSATSWMNEGWWHSDAVGALDANTCKLVEEGEDKLPMMEMYGDKPHPTTLYKVTCELFGQGVSGTCYAAQRSAVNGNSRYVKILIATDCQNARYFEGSKYTIIDGKVSEVPDWSSPYDGIPNEDTGKVPEKQVYGQNSGIFHRETGT